MLKLLLATVLSACAVEPAPVQVVVLGGDNIVVPDRDLCTQYEWFEERAPRRELPYIDAIYGRLVVAGELEAYEGSSSICTSVGDCGPGAVGDTLVWHAQELHRADGSVEVGAFGHAVLGPGRADNPACCEWRQATAIWGAE